MTIQRHFILFILSLLVIAPSIAHQKPYVINFARDKYHAANKNWAIGQDEKGITYFGNDIGLLEFDGIEWKNYQMPNSSLIRSLAVESHSTIYVGALGELGRWDRNQAGKLQYTSFKNMLPPKSLENESFWRIWIDNDKVYFQSFSNIYVYDHHTIQQLTTPKGFLLLTKVRNEYWVQEMYGSLYQLANKQLKKIKGSEFLNGTLTRVILPYGKERYLIGTSTGEIYLYDRKNFIPWNNSLSKLLNGQELNCGIYCAKRNTYYLGTQLSGIYEVDRQGNVLNHFHAANSLQNNTILSLYEDQQNNIWVAMDRGLAYIRYTNKLSYYHTTEGISSAVYTATLWNDYLFIGTNQGVYFVHKEKTKDLEMFSSMKFLKGTEGQVWAFKQIDGQLFCCHNKGLLEIRPDFSIHQPYRIDIGVFKMLETNYNEKEINILVTYKEVYIINKKTKDVHIIREIPDPINEAEIDHLGNIWLGTVNNGVYKCRLNEEMNAFRYYTYYGHKKDKTLPKHLQICKASGRIFFLGNDQFYAYNENKDNLQSSPLLNQCFKNINSLKRIVPINHEASWAITSSSVYRFFYDGYIARIQEAYKIEADNLSLITASENISVLNDSLSLICLDTGFIIHNSQKSKQSNNISLTPPNLEYIRTGKDNSINNNLLNKDIKIAYQDNTVTIGFSVNDAFAKNLFVEYLLEDVDSTWSQAKKQNYISYARLPHGKYTLRLHSTDGLNNYSDDTIIHFRILPPWYLTSWWYLVCTLLIIASFFAIFLLMKKQLQAKNLKRMKIKETEFLRQMNEQLQNEIERKNAELFTQASFIIQKNELILNLT